MRMPDEMASKQLPLAIRLRGSATFGNFIAGENAEVLAYLEKVVCQEEGQAIYLWGGGGCGKSHLLQAACHLVAGRGGTIAYVPLAQAGALAPDMLRGLEVMRLVCIDDIDQVAGQEAWELELFYLYNRLRERDALMIWAARASPGAIAVEMPDLRSRLSWGMVMHVVQPGDEDKMVILQQRARERGMQMSDEVACYLLRHFSRDLHALLAVLDKLDYASQVEQRRLTVPFVRKVMEADAE